MTRLLNRIPDANVVTMIASNRKLMTMSDAPSIAWRARFTIGAGLYQQEASDDDVRAELVAAIEPGLDEFVEREEPVDQRDARVPWNFGVLLGLICAFGTADQRREAAEIERWKYIWPEDETYTPLADALENVQAYLVGKLDRSAARALVAKHGSSRARGTSGFDAQALAAIVAVDDGDASSFNAAIAKMTDEHRFRAREDEFKKDADGLLAALPLGLAQLAKERGIVCTVDSPYLPLQLLP